jgi:hypothetical protein
MEVRVKLQVLSPTVQDRKEADLRPEMFRIRCNGSKCFGGDPEEDAENQLFILVSDVGDLLRDSKDEVKIANLQEFSLAIFDPSRPRQRLALWAMPITATVEAIPFLATLIARSRWPPSAAVRHTSMAVMTRRCAVDIDAPCLFR